MNISIVKTKCIGCYNCVNICPNSAVLMSDSEQGYDLPVIDLKKCTDCGLCAKKCPVLDDIKVQSLKKAYYGASNDKAIVKQSSSGGIFSELAQSVINDGGVVFGAVFDNVNKCVVYNNTKEVDLEKLRRSKYVESKVFDTYKSVKSFLDNEIFVLFVGMPCHIAGLKKFLSKDYDNLLTCDFICGGAPKNKYFKEHLEYLEKKFHSKVVDVNFRPKIYGWKEYAFKVSFENGKEYTNYASLDSYFRGFLYEKMTTRQACEECKFRLNHYSDIILADFWGYKQLPQIKDDDTGISLVIANSDKGLSMLDNIKAATSLTELPLEFTAYNFSKIKNNEEKLLKKRAFEELAKEIGFEKAARKIYMKKTLKSKYKKAIKGFLKKVGIKKQ